MLNIFVNTWGNYNEHGAEGGQWITLPMGEEQLAETLEDIAGRINDPNPEWAIHDYEWTTEVEPREISEIENIIDLNAYILTLSALDDWDAKTYAAACEYWGGDYVDIEDINEYSLYTDITNDYDLGYYWAEESGCYRLELPLSNYFDYEAFGRDIRLETDGGFTSLGWIEKR